MAEESALTLPKATVTKLVRESLPTGTKCSQETVDLVTQCCIEFIHLVASEANEVCNAKKKKTLAGEHIVEALEKLGFNSYLEECRKVMEENREKQASRTKMPNPLRASGLTQDELYEQQQALFANAQAAVEAAANSEKL